MEWLMGFQKFVTPSLYDPQVIGQANYVYNDNKISLFYPCPGYTKCSPYVINLPKGRYIFEVWGAQGGGKNTGIPCGDGGKGGYSRGTVQLENAMTFYVYIGSSGTKGGDGGFNGGGAVGSKEFITGQSGYRAPGGGATDIRTIPGQNITLKTVNYITEYYGPENSLHSRVIVAGGGGGNSEVEGYGGGEHGSLIPHDPEPTTSGNQISGGITHTGTNADLGFGGFTTRFGQGISGGGGGYYGGGGGTFGYGGSGYIDLNFFSEAETIAGNQNITSINGENTIGNVGDGCARITALDISVNTYLAFVLTKFTNSFMTLFVSESI